MLYTEPRLQTGSPRASARPAQVVRRLTIVVSVDVVNEWGSIDEDDTVLNEGLGSDKLIVSGVVDGIDDSGLSGESFGSPGEVTVVVGESSELGISSSSSDVSNLLGGELSVSIWSSRLE